MIDTLELAGALDIGQTAPGFDLPRASGKFSLEGKASLEALRGKLVYVDFWASWCVPCRHSFPWLNDMHAKYAASGLRIIAINLDARPADAAEFLAATPADFMLAYDAAGATPRAYGVKGMPSSFLIGPDGKLLGRHMGFRNAALNAQSEYCPVRKAF